jgi:hypothetical protein
MGEMRYSSTILDLSIKTFCGQLHPWGRCPWCLLDRKLCGPYFQPGRNGEEKSFDHAINGMLIIQLIAHCYINSTIPTPVHLVFDKYLILIERVTPFLHSSVKNTEDEV